MAELLDTDNFLVNRSNTTQKLQAQDVMAELLDDDLMLVNRSDITYKITGAEIKDSLDNAVPVTIETVAVSEVEPGVNARYTNKDFTTAVNCDIKSAEPIVYGLKAKSEGSLVVQAKTSVITGLSSTTEATVLELTDDSGLSEFSPGDDIVQNGGGTPVSSAITNVGTVTAPTYSSTLKYNGSTFPDSVNAFDGDPNTNTFNGFGGTFDDITWDASSFGFTSGSYKLEIKASDGNPYPVLVNGVAAGTCDSGFATIGTFSNIDNITIEPVGTSTTAILTAIKINGVELIDGQTFTNLTLTDDTNLANFRVGDEVQGGVSITAIDEAAPSITTDGGSWSGTDGSGDGGEAQVTGPSVTASGKVGSVDAAATPPTLTVSASDGRWLVTEADYQEDLKLNKVAQSKDFVEVDDAELFCIFDAEGNISDISGEDPGYRDMVSAGTTFESFNLKFPALFSNGKTPDQTLPSGATLCIDVKATNISNIDYKLDTCITPEDPDPEPQADMHGLRFDSARETSLSRSSSSSNSWTLSCWVKNSESSGNGYILSKGGTAGINVTSTGELFYWTGSGAIQLGLVSTNTWSQVVVTYTNSTLTGYVNGIQTGTASIDASDFSKQVIGTNTDGNSFDGYLSEYYFVDGQALTPTVFGYDYENQGKWAPLDSAVIKQNIEDAKAAAFPNDNTSEVWSNYLVSSNGFANPAVRAFDGEVSTDALNNASTSTQTITFTPPSPISATSLRVYSDYGNTGGKTFQISVNGGAYQFGGEAYTTGWLDLTSQITGNEISEIVFQINPGGINARYAVYAIEVDGEILVDKGFGGGGFYLPFDPAAVGGGQDLPNTLTALTDLITPSLLFNGDPSNGALDFDGAFNVDNNFALTFTPAAPIVFSSTVEVYSPGSPNTPYFNTLSANLGSGFGPEIPVVQNTWVTVATGSGTLTAIRASAKQNGAPMNAIRIDGETLISYNNIGVDDSGNENNFHDQNFAVGDTSQVWSSGGNNAELEPGYSWQNAFDGSLSTSAYVYNNTGVASATCTFASITGSIRIYAGNSGTGGSTAGLDLITFSDGTVIDVSNTVAGIRFMPQWIDVGNKTNITSVTLSTNASNGPLLFAIEFDGVTLVDANIQDTVTDTPVKNYATLLTGENGNLVATGNSSITYLGEVGTDYYYEEDGIGAVHTGGATFASVNGKTYNFGQQPFAISGYDDSENWTSKCSTTATIVTDFAGLSSMFDGDPNTYGGILAGTLDISGLDVTGSTLTFKVVAAVDSAWEIKANGVSIATGSGSQDGVTGTISGGTLTAIQLINTSADTSKGTNFATIAVDNSILVDTGNPLVAAQANTLFQKWSEWNNVSMMLATNPAHVARFNTMKAAMEAFPEEKTAFRAAIAANFASSDLTATQQAFLLQD